MTDDLLYVCDSNIAWHHNRYSKHHLMAALAESADVLFVNPAEELCPHMREHGLGRIHAPRRVVPTDVDRLSVFTPLNLPGHGSFGTLQRLDERHAAGQLRRMVARYGERDLILFLGNAWRVFLMDELPGVRFTIYHCSDDFPALFQGEFRRKFEARERELIERADLVVCSHPSLVEKCTPHARAVVYLQHAVDERFMPPADFLEWCPADLTDIPRPRVGFIGWVDSGIDYPLLMDAARRTPDVSYVISGLVRPDCRQVAEEAGALPNVWLMGRREWAQLPPYLWHVDVGIIPFKVDEYNASGSPLKLFEYVGAGLPVVSTKPWCPPGLEPYVTRASTGEEFAEAVGKIVAMPRDEARVGQQLGVMQDGFTWTARARELAKRIDTALGGPTDP